MSPARVFAFVAQSVVIGLAAAFVVVLLRPGLLQSRGPAAASTAGYSEAVEASSPAVVNIYTAQLSETPMRNPSLTGQGLGSGVIMDSQGYVITNWHVVRDADQIRVQLADGRIAIPSLLVADPETELALLKIELDDLPAIRLGRSDTLRTGDIVLAIGNSFGLSQTVTQGIVSATGRGQLGLVTFEDFIQTDAAINIGNSGGALVNLQGELVGINTAVINNLARDQAVIPDGIGFAIPVNLVRGVMDQLIENGRVIRGWLGVDPRNLTQQESASLGIPGGGIYLLGVTGPAQAAGLRPGDVLTHIDGEPIASSRQAMNRVAANPPGTKLSIQGLRPSGAFTVEAVLEERVTPRLRQP